MLQLVTIAIYTGMSSVVLLFNIKTDSKCQKKIITISVQDTE